MVFYDGTGATFDSQNISDLEDDIYVQING
jgi:hypothetical protein